MQNIPDFLKDGGEMGEVMRQMDWAATHIGHPDTWPPSLRITLGAILHSAFPMFLFWGPDLICFYNDAFRPSLGNNAKHPAAGKLGKDVWSEIWEFIGPLIEQVMTSGQAVWFEDQLVPFFRNGQMENIYWTFSYSPAYGDNGQIAGVLVVCTETTKKIEQIREQERYLRIVRESEERFRTMAEGASILIAVGDETGNSVYFNAAWLELTGKPVSDLLQYGWADLIHPEDRDRFVQIFLTAFETRAPFTGEFRLLNKEGAYTWLLAQGSPRFRPDGSFAGYISSCIDITSRKMTEEALKESERNMRLMILQAPVAICIFKGNDYILEIVNPLMEEMLGKKVGDLEGRPFFDAMPEVRDQGLEAILKKVVAERISFKSEEQPFELPRATQLEIRYVTYIYEPLTDTTGQVGRIIVVAIDVTAQVLARRKINDIVAERTHELAGANRHLQRSNAELSQFAYIASHDLQEPARKISIYAQMLESSAGGLDQNPRRYLEKIRLASSRMLTLIRDVLAFSELAKESPHFEPVPLHEIIEEVKTEYELVIEQKNALIHVIHLPTVEAIPLQMYQLFVNLVSNALKYVRADVAPAIAITAEAEGANYHIRVADNGIGFDPGHADQIFNIFKRLHRKNEYSGNGIGLAMCKKIVENHHGQIYATGSPDRGAIFHIILPAVQPRLSGSSSLLS